MRNIATSVRINGDAMNILSSLSTRLGRPKAQAIETALKALDEKTFWADVQQVFEQAASDPSEDARQRAEIGLWDQASESDFRDEGLTRSFVIVSSDAYNQTESPLAAIIPLTRSAIKSPIHLRISPEETGLDGESTSSYS